MMTERKIESEGFVDLLTGLYNRKGFNDLSRKELDRAGRENHAITLFYIDVYDPVTPRKTYSKGTERKLLIQIAKCLKKACRNTDLIARFKDNGFFILTGQTDAESAMVILHRLRETLDRTIGESPISFRVSVGAVTYLVPPSSIETMVDGIEKLMHQKTKVSELSHQVLDSP
jgi:diguanylate cyclase (GGDEF)-like protein